MENLTHVPSKEWNLRTKGLISNAQFIEDPEDKRLISGLINSLLGTNILKPMNLTAWMSLSSHSY